MRIDTITLPPCCQSASVAEAAVMQEMQDAGERAREKKREREDARTDRRQQMQQATRKLREMASRSRTMGLLQFGMSIGAEALSFAGGTLAKNKDAAKATKPTKSIKAGKEQTCPATKPTNIKTPEPKSIDVHSILSLGGRALAHAAKTAPSFDGGEARLQAEKSVIEARQEVHAAREEMAKEAANEAERVAESSLQRLEAMQRLAHEGQLAILRG